MRRTAHKKGQSTHQSKTRSKNQRKKESTHGPTHKIAQGKATRGRQAKPTEASPELCHHCSKDLTGAERALFVEEEVGRVFCSEACITGYFAPEIKRLEKEYLKKLSPRDLSGDERENLAHLRWATLQKPDETWREKTLAGDQRYTLISKFAPRGQKPVWCVCICLFLRGEPSFLYLAFPTQNVSMVNHFRKGEQVARPAKKKGKSHEAEGDAETTDRLAASWTEDDLLQAELRQARRKDDIPREQFEKYLKYFEETLEAPDEVWSTALQVGRSKGAEDRSASGSGSNTRSGVKASRLKNPTPAEDFESEDLRGEASDFGGDSGTDSDPTSGELSADSVTGLVNEDKRLYHFLRAYSNEKPILWYIIVARDTDEDEEIEILDSFPTHDESLVHRYRTGRQDVGEGPAEEPLRRVLH